jgi:hypothetical protein
MLMAVLAAFLFVAATAQAQVVPPPATPGADRTKDADTTYGRVKEYTAGQKMVIDVDNAPDKDFDLKDKDVTYKLESGLKVGDPVKIVERDNPGAGKGKTIEVAKHEGGGVKHGDADRKK